MAHDEGRDPLELLREVIAESGMQLISPHELEAMAAAAQPSHATEAEIAANVASLQAVPLAELPDGPARHVLLWQAQEGRDVYAYASIVGRWYVWVNDRRYTPAEWLEHFTQ